MKKKIEALLRDGSVAGNVEHEALQKNYQSAKRALERAKIVKSNTKTAYRAALGKDEKDHDHLFELLTVFRQAKSMQQFHRAAHKLAKYKMHKWLESFLKNMEMPHEPLKTHIAKPQKASKSKASKGKTSGRAKTSKSAVTTPPPKRQKERLA